MIVRIFPVLIVIAVLSAACASTAGSGSPSTDHTVSNEPQPAAEKTPIPITYSYADKIVTLYDVPGYDDAVTVKADLPDGVAEKTTYVSVLDRNGKVAEDKIAITYDEKGLKSITFKNMPVAEKK